MEAAPPSERWYLPNDKASYSGTKNNLNRYSDHELEASQASLSGGQKAATL